MAIVAAAIGGACFAIVVMAGLLAWWLKDVYR
jgi:hypothetical protein